MTQKITMVLCAYCGRRHRLRPSFVGYEEQALCARCEREQESGHPDTMTTRKIIKAREIKAILLATHGIDMDVIRRTARSRYEKPVDLRTDFGWRAVARAILAPHEMTAAGIPLTEAEIGQ